MLEHIKSLIKEAQTDPTTFDQFYVRFLIDVQDQSMEYEMRSLVSKHRITVIKTDKYLKSIYATLKKGGDIAMKIPEFDITLNHNE